ncbi:hypothetical protein EXIGLDRAFT_640536 [Exidia glandulosa HHB12029]|uniref:Protein kinase domain-containing protein n=1 Tax=Exidia glandulosa HHB12029 TaxID=1314781 RepID=A0A165MJL9_EXIGL|nr:hypothetical protein EXIGLDRAFT_640536 [Exidia glandulosa HHB12029]
MARNPLQDDYVRYPKHTRGGLRLVAHIESSAARGLYDLTPSEKFWRDVQPYLLSRGYRLRPRYAPGWVAPWIGTDIFPRHFEDNISLLFPGVIDARRELDDSQVAIKWIPHAPHTRDEFAVHEFVSTPEMRADPRNHCNPLLDSFPHPSNPDGVFIVMPWLDDIIGLPLEHVNEVVDMMLQTFEGLVFLHEHRIAHRDCSGWNILQDARSAFPGVRCHPLRIGMSEDAKTSYWPRPRCMCNFRYYFIDFGLSTRFEGPGPYLVTGTMGRDQSAPELSETVPYDPFKTDVYMLGNHFLQAFVVTCSNLEFLRPLLVQMTRSNPDARPTAAEALRKLKRAARKPYGIPFRWRLRRREDPLVKAVALDIYCVFRETFFQLRHLFLRTNELSFGRP